MQDEHDTQRAERLARARAFLDAGRTQISPAPQPAAAQPPSENAADEARAAKSEPESAAPADPTRFGDWEKNGRCIDF
jgi:hypothetical protein